jgi:hypothetical protein
MRTFKFMRYGAFSDDLVTTDELAAWSKRFGFSLPSRYTAFMVRNNGGSIYPSVLEHQHPQIKPVTAIKEFFDWRRVLKHSRLDQPPEDRSIAPDHLIIGRTTVDDQIVLRLHTDAPGAVFLTGHNTSPNWNSDGQDEFGFIAKDFGSFIDGLREPMAGEIVYLGIWSRGRPAELGASISLIDV